MIYIGSALKTLDKSLSKTPRPQTAPAIKASRSDSVTQLIEKTKAEYRVGNIKNVESNLKAILKKVGSKGSEKQRPESSTTWKAKSRPKSARPTRFSAFPEATTFSECESEMGVDSADDFEIEKLVDEQDILDVVSKSTVVPINGEPGSSRPASAKSNRPKSAQKSSSELVADKQKSEKSTEKLHARSSTKKSKQVKIDSKIQVSNSEPMKSRPLSSPSKIQSPTVPEPVKNTEAEAKEEGAKKEIINSRDNLAQIKQENDVTSTSIENTSSSQLNSKTASLGQLTATESDQTIGKTLRSHENLKKSASKSLEQLTRSQELKLGKSQSTESVNKNSIKSESQILKEGHKSSAAGLTNKSGSRTKINSKNSLNSLEKLSKSESKLVKASTSSLKSKEKLSSSKVKLVDPESQPPDYSEEGFEYAEEFQDMKTGKSTGSQDNLFSNMATAAHSRNSQDALENYGEDFEEEFPDQLEASSSQMDITRKSNSQLTQNATDKLIASASKSLENLKSSETRTSKELLTQSSQDRLVGANAGEINGNGQSTEMKPNTSRGNLTKEKVSSQESLKACIVTLDETHVSAVPELSRAKDSASNLNPNQVPELVSVSSDGHVNDLGNDAEIQENTKISSFTNSHDYLALNEQSNAASLAVSHDYLYSNTATAAQSRNELSGGEGQFDGYRDDFEEAFPNQSQLYLNSEQDVNQQMNEGYKDDFDEILPDQSSSHANIAYDQPKQESTSENLKSRDSIAGPTKEEHRSVASINKDNTKLAKSTSRSLGNISSSRQNILQAKSASMSLDKLSNSKNSLNNASRKNSANIASKSQSNGNIRESSLNGSKASVKFRENEESVEKTETRSKSSLLKSVENVYQPKSASQSLSNIARSQGSLAKSKGSLSRVNNTAASTDQTNIVIDHAAPQIDDQIDHNFGERAENASTENHPVYKDSDSNMIESSPNAQSIVEMESSNSANINQSQYKNIEEEIPSQALNENVQSGETSESAETEAKLSQSDNNLHEESQKESLEISNNSAGNLANAQENFSETADQNPNSVSKSVPDLVSSSKANSSAQLNKSQGKLVGSKSKPILGSAKSLTKGSSTSKSIQFATASQHNSISQVTKSQGNLASESALVKTNNNSTRSLSRLDQNLVKTSQSSNLVAQPANEDFEPAIHQTQENMPNEDVKQVRLTNETYFTASPASSAASLSARHGKSQEIIYVGETINSTTKSTSALNHNASIVSNSASKLRGSVSGNVASSTSSMSNLKNTPGRNDSKNMSALNSSTKLSKSLGSLVKNSEPNMINGEHEKSSSMAQCNTSPKGSKSEIDDPAQLRDYSSKSGSSSQDRKSNIASTRSNLELANSKSKSLGSVYNSASNNNQMESSSRLATKSNFELVTEESTQAISGPEQNESKQSTTNISQSSLKLTKVGSASSNRVNHSQHSLETEVPNTVGEIGKSQSALQESSQPNLADVSEKQSASDNRLNSRHNLANDTKGSAGAFRESQSSLRESANQLKPHQNTENALESVGTTRQSQSSLHERNSQRNLASSTEKDIRQSEPTIRASSKNLASDIEKPEGVNRHSQASIRGSSQNLVTDTEQPEGVTRQSQSSLRASANHVSSQQNLASDTEKPEGATRQSQGSLRASKNHISSQQNLYEKPEGATRKSQASIRASSKNLASDTEKPEGATRQSQASLRASSKHLGDTEKPEGATRQSQSSLRASTNHISSQQNLASDTEKPEGATRKSQASIRASSKNLASDTEKQEDATRQSQASIRASSRNLATDTEKPEGATRKSQASIRASSKNLASDTEKQEDATRQSQASIRASSRNLATDTEKKPEGATRQSQSSLRASTNHISSQRNLASDTEKPEGATRQSQSSLRASTNHISSQQNLASDTEKPEGATRKSQASIRASSKNLASDTEKQEDATRKSQASIRASSNHLSSKQNLEKNNINDNSFERGSHQSIVNLANNSEIVDEINQEPDNIANNATNSSDQSNTDFNEQNLPIEEIQSNTLEDTSQDIGISNTQDSREHVSSDVAELDSGSSALEAKVQSNTNLRNSKESLKRGSTSSLKSSQRQLASQSRLTSASQSSGLARRTSSISKSLSNIKSTEKLTRSTASNSSLEHIKKQNERSEISSKSLKNLKSSASVTASQLVNDTMKSVTMGKLLVKLRNGYGQLKFRCTSPIREGFPASTAKFQQSRVYTA
jgi:hypothetical protein